MMFGFFRSDNMRRKLYDTTKWAFPALRKIFRFYGVPAIDFKQAFGFVNSPYWCGVSVRCLILDNRRAHLLQPVRWWKRPMTEHPQNTNATSRCETINVSPYRWRSVFVWTTTVACKRHFTCLFWKTSICCRDRRFPLRFNWKSPRKASLTR